MPPFNCGCMRRRCTGCCSSCWWYIAWIILCTRCLWFIICCEPGCCFWNSPGHRMLPPPPCFLVCSWNKHFFSCSRKIAYNYHLTLITILASQLKANCGSINESKKVEIILRDYLKHTYLFAFNNGNHGPRVVPEVHMVLLLRWVGRLHSCQHEWFLQSQSTYSYWRGGRMQTIRNKPRLSRHLHTNPHMWRYRTLPMRLWLYLRILLTESWVRLDHRIDRIPVT